MEQATRGAEKTVTSTSARISTATAEALAKQRLRLGLLAGRELTTDEVIQAMHAVFVQQPEAIIAEVVQP